MNYKYKLKHVSKYINIEYTHFTKIQLYNTTLQQSITTRIVNTNSSILTSVYLHSILRCNRSHLSLNSRYTLVYSYIRIMFIIGVIKNNRHH